jgi:flagellar hook protein FlgE
MALIESLTSGVSALSAFSKGLSVIGDNIANVNTTGFKGSRVDYEDSFSDILKDSAPSNGNVSDTSTVQIGQGVTVGAIRKDFAQGSLATTGTPSDLGISGNGFFTVKDASGMAYVTRSGDFRIDDQGGMVTSEGLKVQGLNDGSITYSADVDANGKLVFTATATTPPTTVGDLKVDAPLTVAAGTIVDNTGGAFTTAQIEAAAPQVASYTVSTDGSIICSMSDGTSFTRGQVLLQNFNDTSALVRQGGDKYTGMAAAGPIGGATLSAANAPGSNGLGQIQSGTLELSNVDLTQQFSDMITAQRSFQAASRIITVSDSILEEVVNLKRS